MSRHHILGKLWPWSQLCVPLIHIHICAVKFSWRKLVLKTDANRSFWSSTQQGFPDPQSPSLLPKFALPLLSHDQLQPAPSGPSASHLADYSSPASLRKQDHLRRPSAFTHQTYTLARVCPLPFLFLRYKGRYATAQIYTLPLPVLCISSTQASSGAFLCLTLAVFLLFSFAGC